MGRAADRKRSSRGGKGLTYGLVILFCLFAGAFLFLRSPYFDIKRFWVEGNSRVPTDEIVARSGQDTSNIFAFDVDKASRLIEASPWIETVAVRRRLPDTIEIVVTERTPIAFTPAGDSLWLVDRSGRVLGKDDGSWPELIALTGPQTALSPGQFLARESYGWGLRVLSVLGPLARERLTEVSVQDTEVTLILDDGCRALLGKERNDPENQASVLESILDELARGGKIAERIDLRFDRPAVKEQFTKIPEG